MLVFQPLIWKGPILNTGYDLSWPWRRLAGMIVALGTLCATALQSSATQVLSGHVPRSVARSVMLGRLAEGTNLDLVIGLPLRNQGALKRLLDQTYDPTSSHYHHYLRPDQFTASFGPTEEDYQAVIEFTKAHRLSVKATHSNRTLLDVNGAVGDIEKTFHINLLLYRHPTEARAFYAPDVEPSVDLDVPLLAISGLDNYTAPHPQLVRRPLAKLPTASRNPAGPSLASQKRETPDGGSGSGGTYMGNDFRAAYVPGVSLNGSGQLLGLFELDSYFINDITAYETETHLAAVTVSNVLVNGVSGTPSASDSQVAEVSLDIEMALSMAPGLSAIIVYEGTSANDILNAMATSGAAQQLSCSWGFNINSSTEQILQQFAAQGQSFFAASGDVGAFVGSVDPPADNPYLTVVGATTLSTSGPGGHWTGETTWNWQSTGEGSGASSGGVSTIFASPIWQQGISMSANGGSTAMRNLPDVSMVGDNVRIIYANGLSGNFGGTSVGTPLWAGFAALVNQQNAALGQPSLGFINPALYALGKSSAYASCFHDITTGNNTNSSSPTEFHAVPGYDLCTGWGTPTGSNLINALVQMPQDNVNVLNGGFESGSFAFWTLIGDTRISNGLANGVISSRMLQGGSEFIHSGTYAAFLGEPNTLASLSQTLPTFAGQAYLLSFWLVNPTGDTPNEFQVSWNGTTLFDQIDIGMLTWTNFQFVVAATGTNTVLTFAVRNDNSGFGLDDVGVEAIPMPSFQAIRSANGSLAFAWSAQTGLTYQFQYTTTLAPANWINTGTAITATNGTMSVSVPAPSDAQGFYRLLLLP
jgi:subtilase family serine protease